MPAYFLAAKRGIFHYLFESTRFRRMFAPDWDLETIFYRFPHLVTLLSAILSQIETTLHNLASPKRSHTFWGLMLVTLMAAALLWVKHKAWIEAPNAVMLSDSPDGFKNYMTAAWHVAHDSSYVHYGGMSYPYGEHVLFTDNQPMLSSSMQWWNRNVSNIGDQVIGIMNTIEFLSLLLGCGVLFLLLRKLHLPVWYAGLAALGMMFLSPQQSRIEGHFGLSHTWVFPLVLLLLCRYEERHSRRYQSLLIGIVVWFSAQLHFYYLGLSAIFLGFYTLYHWLRDPSWRNIWVRASHLAVMILLPFALLNVWIQWSDYSIDRPASPYGFTTYLGQWEGVFLPYQNFPLYQWINRNIVTVREVNGESFAYCGLAAVLFTVWLLRRRFRLFEPEWEEAAYHRVHKRYLAGIFTAALLCLLFACGFPFAIKGLEWMVDYLGPLRQFRGLGRFTWGWFYVINVVLFYVAWNQGKYLNGIPQWFAGFVAWLKAPLEPLRNLFSEPLPATTTVQVALETTADAVAEGPKVDTAIPLSERWGILAKIKAVSSVQVFKWLLVLTPLVLVDYEAYYFQRHREIKTYPNVANKKTANLSADSWLNKVDFSKFQALLPLPYYHIGSENIWLEFVGNHYSRTQMTAFFTGVPDMGVNMSRTAIGKMLKSVQLVYHPGEIPRILDELPDNRPLALMVYPSRWEEVQRRYKHLLRKATPVYDHPEMKVLSLSLDSIRSYVRWHTDSVHQAMSAAALYPAGAWRSTQPNTPLFQQSYDLLTTAPHVFQGKGAFTGYMDDTVRICRQHLPKGQYTLSLWIYAKQDMGMTHEVRIVENERSNGQEVHFGHEGLRFYLQSIVNDWALFEVPFEVYGNDSQMTVWTYKHTVHEPFGLDEVLIKPRDATVYRIAKDWFSYNNFWYRWTK